MGLGGDIPEQVLNERPFNDLQITVVFPPANKLDSIAAQFIERVRKFINDALDTAGPVMVGQVGEQIVDIEPDRHGSLLLSHIEKGKPRGYRHARKGGKRPWVRSCRMLPE